MVLLGGILKEFSKDPLPTATGKIPFNILWASGTDGQTISAPGEGWWARHWTYREPLVG